MKTAPLVLGGLALGGFAWWLSKRPAQAVTEIGVTPTPLPAPAAPLPKFKVGDLVSFSPSYTQYGVIAAIKPLADGSFTYDINVTAAIGAGGMARDVPEGIIAPVTIDELSKINATRQAQGLAPLSAPTAMAGYLSGYAMRGYLSGY